MFASESSPVSSKSFLMLFIHSELNLRDSESPLVSKFFSLF